MNMFPIALVALLFLGAFALALVDLHLVRRGRGRAVYTAMGVFVAVGTIVYGAASPWSALLPNRSWDSVLRLPWHLLPTPVILFGVPALGLAWWTSGASPDKPARSDVVSTILLTMVLLMAGAGVLAIFLGLLGGLMS